jgi:hypothetical protein
MSEFRTFVLRTAVSLALALCPAGDFIVCIIFAYAVAPLSKDFAFGEILSFALPKESIQRKRNPIPLESPLKNANLRRKRNSRFANVESLRHPFS